MDTRFAVNGDVRLAYDDLGPPGADPLLMLMGLGASRFWWPPGLVRYLRWRRQLRLLRLTRRTPDDAALAEGVLAAAATPAYPAEEGMARDAMARDRSHGIRSFRDMAAQGRQTRGRWHGPPLRQLRAPALIICGGADPLLRPRASRDTAAAISGARLLILPGVGHFPARTAWPVIAGEMRALADRAR